MFKPWNWIIGTGVYVDDINTDIEQRTKAVIKDLNKVIFKQKIGDNGYFFIFNEENHILVHPNYAGMDGNTLINPSTNNVIFDDFKAALLKPSHSLEYLWDKADDKGNFIYPKVGYVTYFKPLGWYIATTLYVEDYQNKIIELNKKMFLFSGFFILLSLIIAVLISKSITRPLNSLIAAISETGDDGLPTKPIDITGVGEIKELSSTINQMVESIKESRNELEESESFNKLLFEDSMIPLVVMDGETERFIDCNQAAVDIYKFKDIEETIGKTPLEVSAKLQYNGEDSHIVSKRYLSIAKEKGSVIFEWRHQRANGEIWDAEVQLMLFNYKGRELYQFSLLDITERKKAVAELGQARKMEAIGQLAGGVAHDFNNMLSGIMMSAQLLMKPKRGLDKKGLEFVDIILKSSSQAADLTKKLLAFGRKETVNTEIISVHEVIRDTVTILTKTIDKRISIISSFTAEHNIIIGNSSSLQNALINLGINSSHAMSEGGTLTFRTRNIIPDQDLHSGGKGGHFIEIEIEDTGCGIEAENLEFIFEPFFTTKSQGKGSGLGLAAVYGTVHDHSGTIRVTSEVNVGTTFFITLPLSAGKVTSGATSTHDDSHSDGRRGGKILLIDDEEVIRETVSSLLVDLGYEVVTAVDGQDGVAIYQKLKTEIDLIITDMIMPNMNGRETFYKLREINRNCKVLLASGFTNDESIEKMRLSGLNGFINKPFKEDELRRYLDDILHS